jgi:hypothetical protein
MSVGLRNGGRGGATARREGKDKQQGMRLCSGSCVLSAARGG